MIEMVPNWHPVAVHFAIALLLTAVALLLLGHGLGARRRGATLVVVGQWNLWLGAITAAWAVLTGWLAYNSVTHDAIAHQAMTVHLWWAIPTATLFVGLATFFWIRSDASRVGIIPLLLLSLGAVALARTGYLGAENVYRYGLGVQSMPALRANATEQKTNRPATGTQSSSEENENDQAKGQANHSDDHTH